VEFSTSQAPHSIAVKLCKSTENYGVYWYVDAYTESVCTANYRKQTMLGELFDKEPVTWQHARMMDANTASE
jgi:hypothetical protein